MGFRERFNKMKLEGLRVPPNLFKQELLEKRMIVQDNSGPYRVYHTPEGKAYMSVTSWLDSIKTDDDKKGLKAWRERIGDDEANKVMAISTGRGTHLHKLCENLVLNESLDPVAMNNPSAVMLFKQTRRWLMDNVVATLGAEIPLYSDRLQLAGSADNVSRLKNGNIAVLDFKNARNENKEKYIHSYYLQLTIYAEMVKEMYGIAVDEVHILMASEHGFKTFCKRPSELLNMVEEKRLPQL